MNQANEANSVATNALDVAATTNASLLVRDYFHRDPIVCGMSITQNDPTDGIQFWSNVAPPFFRSGYFYRNQYSGSR